MYIYIYTICVNSTTGVPWCDPSFACERFVCHHLIFGAFRFEAVEGRDSGLAVGQPWLGLERCLKGCYAIGVGHLGFYILLDRIQPSFTFLTGFGAVCSSYLSGTCKSGDPGGYNQFWGVMPPAVDETLPPVPDDIPSPGTTQLPWNQIPKFVPGVTNVQEYVQKLKFLAALWPVEYLDQLAPRAALLIEGTAFRKIARIPPSKLKVKTTDGIAALVEAIGSSWGSTELEERYDFLKSRFTARLNGQMSHMIPFCQGWKQVFWSSFRETPH